MNRSARVGADTANPGAGETVVDGAARDCWRREGGSTCRGRRGCSRFAARRIVLCDPPLGSTVAAGQALPIGHSPGTRPLDARNQEGPGKGPRPSGREVHRVGMTV